MYKKIVSLFLCFAIVSCLIIPVSASDDITSSAVSFWDKLVMNAVQTSSDIDSVLGAFASNIGQLVSDSFCASSPDHLHHGNVSSFTAFRRGSYTGDCVCAYCGDHFNCEVTSGQLSTAYTDYVSGLKTDLGTATLINGGVRVYFEPTEINVNTPTSILSSSLGATSYVQYKTTGSYADEATCNFSWYPSSFQIPFDSTCILGYSSNCNSSSITVRVSGFKNFSQSLTCSSGGQFTPINNSVAFITFYGGSDGSVFDGSCSVYANFIPVSGASLPTTNNITPSSRPGGIPVDGSAVFDEETMNYYNAVTKQSYTATDWAFDYESRTYTFTLEDGTTATVVYGDNEITFTDHGNTYTLAYPTETTGGGDGEGGGSGGGTILGLLGKLLDLLGGLITSLLNGLKSLFVPSEDFFSGSLADLKSLFDGKMGLITYPTSVVVNFFDRVTSLDSAAPVFAWTDIRFMDTTLISAGSYNLEDALTTPELQRLHQIYLDCVSAILIFGFLDLCYKKYRDVINK